MNITQQDATSKAEVRQFIEQHPEVHFTCASHKHKSPVVPNTDRKRPYWDKSSAEELTQHYESGRPLGIVAGLSGLVVFDKDSGDCDELMAVLAGYIDRHYFHVRSKTEGRFHIYFPIEHSVFAEGFAKAEYKYTDKQGVENAMESIRRWPTHSHLRPACMDPRLQ